MSDKSPGGLADQDSWDCGMSVGNQDLSVQGIPVQMEDHRCTLHKGCKGVEVPEGAHGEGIEEQVGLLVTEMEQQLLRCHLPREMPLWAHGSPQIHLTELDLCRFHGQLLLTSEALSQELFAPWAPPF